jgi:pyridoxine kinase
MATILCISSQVARGHVGASAQRFVLERLGHEVWVLPTIVLSNHPEHARFSGQVTDPKVLEDMAESLDANGWLDQVAVVVSGYMPSEAHVTSTLEALERVRAHVPKALHLCDPIMGDDPDGLYIDAAAAYAVQTRLVPASDIVTPNRFELSRLAGYDIEDVNEALRGAKSLRVQRVLATSIPESGDDALVNLLNAGERAWVCRVPKRAEAPHGAGDAMAALYLSQLLAGKRDGEALGTASAGVEAMLEASAGADELKLIPSQAAWSTAESRPIQALNGGG